MYFDYIIINDDFNKALHELEAVITANRLVLSQQAKTSKSNSRLDYSTTKTGIT